MTKAKESKSVQSPGQDGPKTQTAKSKPTPKPKAKAKAYPAKDPQDSGGKGKGKGTSSGSKGKGKRQGQRQREGQDLWQSKSQRQGEVNSMHERRLTKAFINLTSRCPMKIGNTSYNGNLSSTEYICMTTTSKEFVILQSRGEASRSITWLNLGR